MNHLVRIGAIALIVLVTCASANITATTIDGNGSEPVVLLNSLEGPSTVVRGFTIVRRVGSACLVASPTIAVCEFTGRNGAVDFDDITLALAYRGY